MTGESAAGVIVSMNRIITKYLISDARSNTLMFFTLSIILIIITLIVINQIEKTQFVNYYLSKCKDIELEISDYAATEKMEALPNLSNLQENRLFTGFGKEDFGLVEFGEVNLADNAPKSRPTSTRTVSFRHSDSTEFDMPFGIDDEDLEHYVPPIPAKSAQVASKMSSLALQEQNAKKLENFGETSRKSRELSHHFLERTLTDASDDCFVNQEHQEMIGTSINYQQSRESISTRVTNSCVNLKDCVVRTINNAKINFNEKLETRSEVVSKIAPLMAAIGIDYLVTLALFPGIESEIIRYAVLTIAIR